MQDTTHHVLPVRYSLYIYIYIDTNKTMEKIYHAHTNQSKTE